ncbi:MULTISPECIES: DUF5071 domain-containing protein [unclassified Imperialibacter]|uniref:DUF5071 domain-containing protein n=1 Tax=unclassified Imperialibacter TaxID=2629706 RepID=UPI001251BE7A|nr:MULTISPECIES: DUF5071 domain-containing protein [unclassified Imperialibacter]CAD5298996.1 conserved hypothetical protein [Imperialibacter sp. 89]CAD5299598.1 conserved hypothetical protein [Imperialibacter sp. 75]VVT21148.1 conserved hypothetical protein [Imperialibacter sp. EC-SDR9]
MKLYQKLKNRIDWNEPVELQLERLAEFDHITNEEIEELAQTCHKSTEAGILLEYLGHERLMPYLHLFLEFLQDMNWPAAGGASKMLTKAGKVIIPEIRRVFQEVNNDQIWHYWILLGIVQYFEKELILEMKADLIELILRADKDGASIQALRILKEKQILSSEEVENRYCYLLDKYSGDLYWTNDLNEEIKPVANKT